MDDEDLLWVLNRSLRWVLIRTHYDEPYDGDYNVVWGKALEDLELRAMYPAIFAYTNRDL